MDESLHNLLMINQSAFHKKVFMNLSDTNLTLGQPKVLDFLKNHNGCVQKEIAAACEIEPATVTSLLLKMEEAGLIERRMQNGNRRSLYVYLTEEGTLMQKKVESVFDGLEKIAFDGFTQNEISNFMELFLRIYNNITR